MILINKEMKKLLLPLSRKRKISVLPWNETHTQHARTRTHIHTHTHSLYCHCFKLLRSSVTGLYSVPRADKRGFFTCLHSTWFLAPNFSNLFTEPINKHKISKNYCSSEVCFLWDTPHREEAASSWNSNVCYIPTTLTFNRDTPKKYRTMRNCNILEIATVVCRLLFQLSYVLYFSSWLDGPIESRHPPWRGFEITLRHTKLGKTPLDEASTRCRKLYFLTTYNNLNEETSVLEAGFETVILTNKRPQIHALDWAATGIGDVLYCWRVFSYV